MTDHLLGRREVIDALRRELVGPAPAGPGVDLDDGLPFDDKVASYGPYTDASSGEEVLGWTRPLKRYGVAVLFPDSSRDRDHSVVADVDDELDGPVPTHADTLTDDAVSDLRRIGDRGAADDSEDVLDLMASRRKARKNMCVLLQMGCRIALTWSAYSARNLPET